MKKFTALLLLPALFALLLGGCAPATTSAQSTSQLSPASSSAEKLSAGKGYVNILVTDAPPKNEVTSIMVTISSIYVHLSANQEMSGAPTTTDTTTDTTTATDTATDTTSATTTTDTGTTTPPASWQHRVGHHGHG